MSAARDTIQELAESNRFKSEVIETYSKAVNQIDDVLEYRFKNMDRDELAGYIRTIIANITPALKRVQDKHKMTGV